MKKLFGTDGIRGVAGQPPARRTHHLRHRPRPRHHLSAKTPLRASSSAWTPASPATGSPPPLPPASCGRSLGRERRCHHHARRRLPRPHSWLRRRRRHLRLAQSLAGQRHQALRPRRLQASRLHRTRHRRRDLPSARGHTQHRRRQTTPPAVNEADRADYVRFLLAAVPGLSLDGKPHRHRLRQWSRLRRCARSSLPS